MGITCGLEFLSGACHSMPESAVVAAVTVAACACVGMLGMLTYMVANSNNMANNNKRPYRRQKDDDDDDDDRYAPSSPSRGLSAPSSPREPTQRHRRQSSVGGASSARRGSVAGTQNDDRWLKTQLKQISHKQDFEMGAHGYASMEDVITRNADVA